MMCEDMEQLRYLHFPYTTAGIYVHPHANTQLEPEPSILAHGAVSMAKCTGGHGFITRHATKQRMSPKCDLTHFSSLASFAYCEFKIPAEVHPARSAPPT